MRLFLSMLNLCNCIEDHLKFSLQSLKLICIIINWVQNKLISLIFRIKIGKMYFNQPYTMSTDTPIKTNDITSTLMQFARFNSFQVHQFIIIKCSLWILNQWMICSLPWNRVFRARIYLVFSVLLPPSQQTLVYYPL